LVEKSSAIGCILISDTYNNKEISFLNLRANLKRGIFNHVKPLEILKDKGIRPWPWGMVFF